MLPGLALYTFMIFSGCQNICFHEINQLHYHRGSRTRRTAWNASAAAATPCARKAAEVWGSTKSSNARRSRRRDTRWEGWEMTPLTCGRAQRHTWSFIIQLFLLVFAVRPEEVGIRQLHRRGRGQLHGLPLRHHLAHPRAQAPGVWPD